MRCAHLAPHVHTAHRMRTSRTACAHLAPHAHTSHHPKTDPRERRLKGGRCRLDKRQICYVCPPARAAVALCARIRQFLIPAPTLPKRTARTSRLSALVGRGFFGLPPADLLPASASCAFVRGHASACAVCALALVALLAALAEASSLYAAAEALC